MQGFYQRLGSMLFVVCFLVVLPLLYTWWEMTSVEAKDSAPRCGEVGVLVGLDGEIPLYDTPENGIIRFTLSVGRVVRVRGEAWHEGQRWCLVAPLDGVGVGWVPSTLLVAPETLGSHHGNFRFCEGDIIGPS